MNKYAQIYIDTIIEKNAFFNEMSQGIRDTFSDIGTSVKYYTGFDDRPLEDQNGAPLGARETRMAEANKLVQAQRERVKQIHKSNTGQDVTDDEADKWLTDPSNTRTYNKQYATLKNRAGTGDTTGWFGQSNDTVLNDVQDPNSYVSTAARGVGAIDNSWGVHDKGKSSLGIDPKDVPGRTTADAFKYDAGQKANTYDPKNNNRSKYQVSSWSTSSL